MELQNLDIDKYINFYRNLSMKYHEVKENDWKINHYSILSWELFKRYLKDEKRNIYSKELSEKAIEIANAQQAKKDEIKEYTDFIILSDNPNDHIRYFIPSVWDWNFYDVYIDTDFENKKKDITKTIIQSPLSEKEIIGKELERLNKTDCNFIGNVLKGIPTYIPNIIGDNYEIIGQIDELASFVSDCYFAKWLYFKLNPQTEPLISLIEPPKLQWNINIGVLYTMFHDLLENGIITWNGKGNEGVKSEIERMLKTYFVDKDGQRLSTNTINQAITKGKGLSKKRIDLSKFSLPNKKR